MRDDQNLRGELDPTDPSDLTNKRYTNAEDLRVANEAQVANDNLEIRINDEIARLDQQDIALADRIDQEILDRIAGDQAIMDLLNEGSSDTSHKYVERDGDDMLGDLTFATDKITLGIDGSATFFGGVNCNYVAALTDDGSFNFFRNKGIATDLNTAFGTEVGTQSIKLYNNGSGFFDGAVKSGTIDTSDPTTAGLLLNPGSAGTAGALYVQHRNTVNATTAAIKVRRQDAAGTGFDTTVDIQSSGSATFTGHLEAASCDGGTY